MLFTGNRTALNFYKHHKKRKSSYRTLHKMQQDPSKENTSIKRVKEVSSIQDEPVEICPENENQILTLPDSLQGLDQISVNFQHKLSSWNEQWTTVNKEPSQDFDNNNTNWLQNTAVVSPGFVCWLKNYEQEQKSKRKPKNSKQQKFPSYCTIHEVQDGLKKGELKKGTVRINSKEIYKAYISNKDRSQEDYLLESLSDRNRALEGDVVAIQLKPRNEWKKNKKTAVVVYIMERIHSRMTVGFLKPLKDNNKQFAMLLPRDYRIPKVRIPATDCPPSFHDNPAKFKNILYKTKITVWNDMRYAVGTIVETIGRVGGLEAETTALLAENDLDITAFSEELLPLADVIPEIELLYREDLRKECVFTIDPLTAHDLDDALSCKELDNGNLEIGVHISDVTYYLKEGTPLDKYACKKATTIYLVNKAYHMLPQVFCSYFSLLPGSDKLTFSVFWEMTKCGRIVAHRFARTVINSCAKLAYEHAQAVIENPNYEDNKLPQIIGNFTSKDLSKAINYLHAIAVNLRKERFERGALQITKAKMVFTLDESTGEPCEYSLSEYKEANKLIEEFMLLANKAVAQKIVDDFPSLAFLRCHEPPNQRMLLELENTLEKLCINVDVSSPKAIQDSISYMKEIQSFDKLKMTALQYLMVKPMTRARYFCAANTTSKEDFHHYALHVPLYTHFTSPIRRYADIVVHRLLTASLGYTKKRLWKVKYLTAVAENCNKQNYHAKCAQEASSNLYLAHYVEQHQPIIQEAVVIVVRKNSFDILINTDSVIRMYPKNFGDDITCTLEKCGHEKKLLVFFPKTDEYSAVTHVIRMFSIVKVSLHRKFKTTKLEAKLLRFTT